MWWKDPLKLVDADDLDGVKDEDAHVIAEAHFRDLLLERPTEYTVLLRLLRRAMSSVLMEGLTERQLEAVRIARLAARSGESPVRLVADSLGINRHNAWKLLERAERRLRMETLDEKSTDICVHRHVSEFAPSEKQIRRRMATLPKRCAGGVDGCRMEIPGRYDLCPVCRRHFGTFSEWPGWLILEVRRLRTEHRKAAIAALYEVASTDELSE